MQMFFQWKEDQEDQQDILVKTGHGSVYAEQALTFTPNSIVIAAAKEDSLKDIRHNKVKYFSVRTAYSSSTFKDCWFADVTPLSNAGIATRHK